MDGSLIPWKDAKIHILTHSLHYGSAVFEGIRFYKTEKGPAVFRLKDHISRLFKSAKTMYIKIPYKEEEICKAVLNLIKENSLDSGYIRPIVYYGYGKMGLGVKEAKVNVSIAVWPWGSYLGEDPIKIKISNFMRIHPKSSVTHAKISGHYVNSILAGEEARTEGFNEALLLDYKGNIAEGPGENLFIVKDNELQTPLKENILPGITRDSIIKIASDLGIKVVEKIISQKDVYNADEAFFTGTAAEITPISYIDGKKLKTEFGPITKKLKKAYQEVVTDKSPKYQRWLSHVN